MTIRASRSVAGLIVGLSWAFAAGCGEEAKRFGGDGIGGRSIGMGGSTVGLGGALGMGGESAGAGGVIGQGGTTASGGNGGAGGAAGSAGKGGKSGKGGAGGVSSTGGAGGSLATGGASGTGGVVGMGGVMGSGGAVHTGGVVGTGGMQATGGMTGTAGMAAMGGTAGGAGGAGMAGAGGAGGTTTTCDDLSARYTKALTAAKDCTGSSKNECSTEVYQSLSCPGCKTFVNDATRLTTIANDWTKAGCDKVVRICPKVLCIAISGATCTVTAMAGMCVDTTGLMTTQ